MASRTEWARRPGRSSKWITPLRRLSLYIRDGFRCSYCGKDLRDAAPRDVTLDHLLPRCKGGTHEDRNLVTACGRCNYGRKEALWYRYATAGAKDRIRKLVRRSPNRALARAILRGDVPRAEGLRALE